MQKPRNIILSILLALSLVLGTLSPAFANQSFSSNTEQSSDVSLATQEDIVDSASVSEETSTDASQDAQDTQDSTLPTDILINQYDGLMAEAHQDPESTSEEKKLHASAVDEALGSGRTFAKGELLVVFKEEVSQEEAQEVIAAVDSEPAEVITKEAIDSQDIVLAEVSDQKSVVETIKELSQNPAVESVQPNYLYKVLDESPEGETGNGIGIIPLITSINDPGSSSQWHLNSISAPLAWDLKKVNGSVAVAVIDTGIDMTHPDLVNNIVGAYDVTRVDHVLNNDPDSHGTHVAGIVAAETNNGVGVSGVTYNAKIVPIKIYDETAVKPTEKITTTHLVNAYKYLLNGAAQQYNVKVINMSLGGEGDVRKDGLLETEIDKAYAAGILTVCASGNSGFGKNYPSDYPTCVSVINLDSDTHRFSGSNFGPEEDISAPGTNIYSTVPNGYFSLNGTSMASPMVAGVAAMVYSARPNLSANDVKNILYSTATDIYAPGRDDDSGYGRVNAAAAVASAQTFGVINGPDTIGIGSQGNYSLQSFFVGHGVNWSVISGTGSASINTSGVLTGAASGTVTVKATSNQDSNVFAYKTVTVIPVMISYTTHVQNIGWQPWVVNGELAGTVGKSLRMEAFQIKLPAGNANGSVVYNAHVQDIGWQKSTSLSATNTWFKDGAPAGTSGLSKRVEALQISLTGPLGVANDIYYSVQAQNVGWLGWAKNGEMSGTAGYSYRLEAIKIIIVPKGTNPNTVLAIQSTISMSRDVAYLNASATSDVVYSTMAHVQNLGNRNFTNTSGFIGTTGRSLRIEALTFTNLTLPAGVTSGSIEYRTHIQDIGDQEWMKLGELSGTTAQSKRLEAINIRLTGDLATKYDVYYRTHVQNIGWTGWAKNGTDAANKATWSGSAGYSYRMEAMQIVIVKKGGTAPGIVGSSYFRK